MKKKKLWLVTGVAAAAVLAAGTVTFAYQSGSDSEEQTVYKEVTVEKGNLTAGVTESGSVTIGTLDQTLDFQRILPLQARRTTRPRRTVREKMRRRPPARHRPLRWKRSMLSQGSRLRRAIPS